MIGLPVDGVHGCLLLSTEPAERGTIVSVRRDTRSRRITLVGHVDVAGVRYELPDGRVLLDDVSFRVGEGAKVALVGANGAGKTTLLRIITGDLVPHAGVVTRSGGLGVMRQMVNAGLGDGADGRRPAAQRLARRGSARPPPRSTAASSR